MSLFIVRYTKNVIMSDRYESLYSHSAMSIIISIVDIVSNFLFTDISSVIDEETVHVMFLFLLVNISEYMSNVVIDIAKNGANITMKVVKFTL